MPRAFHDDALLLIGHGSARYADAGGVLHDHAKTLRERFAEIGVGLLNGVPSVADALASLRARHIYVLPFFMEDGYFARVAVPKALAGERERLLTYCEPVGTHQGMADLIEARVLRGCRYPGATSVVLVGHGSARAPGRTMALHQHRERLRKSGQFASVEVAFLEETPLVPDVLASAHGTAVAVVGVFAGDGLHVRDDLPRLIEAERYRLGDRLLDLGSIGAEAGMADLILDQVTRAALVADPQGNRSGARS